MILLIQQKIQLYEQNNKTLFVKQFLFVLVWILEKNELFDEENQVNKSQSEICSYLLKKVQLKFINIKQLKQINEKISISSISNDQEEKNAQKQCQIKNDTVEQKALATINKDQKILNITKENLKQKQQYIKQQQFDNLIRNSDNLGGKQTNAQLEESCMIFSENMIRQRMALSLSKDEDQQSLQIGNNTKFNVNNKLSNYEQIIPIQFKFAIEKGKIQEQNLNLLKQSPHDSDKSQELQQSSPDSKLNDSLSGGKSKEIKQQIQEENKLNSKIPEQSFSSTNQQSAFQNIDQNNNIQNNNTIQKTPIINSVIRNNSFQSENGRLSNRNQQNMLQQDQFAQDPISNQISPQVQQQNNLMSNPYFSFQPQQIQNNSYIQFAQQIQNLEQIQQQQSPIKILNSQFIASLQQYQMDQHLQSPQSIQSFQNLQQIQNQNQILNPQNIQQIQLNEMNQNYYNFQQNYLNYLQNPYNLQNFEQVYNQEIQNLQQNYMLQNQQSTSCNCAYNYPTSQHNSSCNFEQKYEKTSQQEVDQILTKIIHLGEEYKLQSSNPVSNSQTPRNIDKQQPLSSDSKRRSRTNSDKQTENTVDFENINANINKYNLHQRSNQKRKNSQIQKSCKVPSDESYNYVQVLFDDVKESSTNQKQDILQDGNNHHYSNSQVEYNEQNYQQEEDKYNLEKLNIDKFKQEKLIEDVGSFSSINSNSSTNFIHRKSLSSAVEDENILVEKQKQKLKEKSLLYLSKELFQDKKPNTSGTNDDRNKLQIDSNQCCQNQYLKQINTITESGEANPVFANLSSKRRLSMVVQQNLIKKSQEFQLEFFTPKNTAEYETCSSLDINDQ